MPWPDGDRAPGFTHLISSLTSAVDVVDVARMCGKAALSGVDGAVAVECVFVCFFW